MIRKRHITLKDIAAEAGCSFAVVSTVLNGSKGTTKVGREMREKIEEIARRENYRPNFASRSLRMQSPLTLGIYVQPKSWNGIGHSYEMNILQGIERAAREFGYDIIILNIDCGILPEVCAERLVEKRIDGVILLRAEPDADWLERLARVSGNIVAIDYCGSTQGLNTVAFDNREAVRLAVRHLKELGRRRIGFIGSCLEHPPLDALIRYQSFRELAREPEFAGIEFRSFSREESDLRCDPASSYCQQEGRAGMDYFLAQPEPPDAILAYNSICGVTALMRAVHCGVEVPKALSLIGIDDLLYTTFCDPPLTVIDHRLRDMGYAGCRKLIERIRDRDPEFFQAVFPPELILRSSTAPAD